MKKWICMLLLMTLFVALTGCKREQESIVEDLEGPEGIELFAGLWYYENKDIWVEIYYDGAWCTFENGGILRAYGSLNIADQTALLEPAEGEDHLSFTAEEGKLKDKESNILFQVTEVGVRKPLIVNDLGIPDRISADTEVAGETDLTMAKAYAGFYISEDGIFALELFPDGTYELQEYGLLVESGTFLRLREPDYQHTYAVDSELKIYRLVIAQEERLYLGDCGIFAPGEKGTETDE